MAEVADIVVVGAGTAGLCVAVEAARRGLQVDLVEASDQVGGTLRVWPDTSAQPAHAYRQGLGSMIIPIFTFRTSCGSGVGTGISG